MSKHSIVQIYLIRNKTRDVLCTDDVLSVERVDAGFKLTFENGMIPSSNIVDTWFEDAVGVVTFMSRFYKGLLIDDIPFERIQMGFPGMPEILKSVESLHTNSNYEYYMESVRHFVNTVYYVSQSVRRPMYYDVPAPLTTHTT